MERIIQTKPAAVILREKDMTEDDYGALADKVLELCHAHGVLCILHSFAEVAMQRGADAIHLPLPMLRQMSDERKACFSKLGTSCHSVEDAIEAEALGCTYLIAGHIFDTDCKKGLPGRGLEFLREVCSHVSIPVYAIGGISRDNYASVRQTGASGACIMSGLMRCENVQEYMAAFDTMEAELNL
jgi:thiamine-phosphate pyrophosphorylase